MKTYWTVKTPTTTLYFKKYKNAKAEAAKDYRDNPVKHTVLDWRYSALDHVGAFED